MDASRVEDAVLRWYAEHYDESARLERTGHGRLEALRTRELIGRHLGETPMSVLDVGGGAGAYAEWLASMGHRVHLVDPVPRHVEAAGALPGVTAGLGDARALGGPDAAYDLTLVLGPLYHLADRGERVLALREAARVTRPGGALLAAAIGRYYVLGQFALAGALTAERAPRLEHFVRTGEKLDDDYGFPVRRSHLWDELRDEALDAGWQDVRVLAVEGPVGYGVDLVAAERLEDVVEQSALVARMTESDPRMLDLSPHLMVTGRAP